MNRQSLLACVSGSVLLAVTAPAAWAQQAPVGASGDQAAPVGEVIVTANKRSQSINKVGLTITAATAETLTTRGVSGPADLAKVVPGFSFTKSIYSTPVYTLRGVGFYDATFGTVPAVAVYSDQIPRNFPVMSSALDLDLERVEVLKGPQGTLFGQSSTGGAINYITAKPTEDFRAGMTATYERFNRAEISGFVSGTIAPNLTARLAGDVNEGGDYQTSQSRPNDHNGATRKLEGRLTVDWKPTDRFKLELSGTAVRDNSDVQAPQYLGSYLDTYSTAALAAANANPATRNPYGFVDNAAYAGLTTPGSSNYNPSFLGAQSTIVARLNGSEGAVRAAGAAALLGTPVTNDSQKAEWTPGLLGQSHNAYYQATARADYKLTDTVTLTSITAFAHQRLNYAQDLDGTTAAGVDVPLFGNVDTFNQEIRVALDTPRFNVIVGGDFDDDRTSQSNFFSLADYSGNEPVPGIPITLTLNNFTSRLKSYAAFGNAEFHVNNNLSVLGGVRFTQNDQRASYCYNDPAVDAPQNTAKVFSIFQDLFTGSTLPAIQPGQCFPLGDGLQGTTFGKSTLSPVNRTLNENNVSFRVGANYKFDQGTLLYVTISQGYKAGALSAIGASSTSQYSSATQEKVLVYEGGFKAPFADHRIQLNGSVFYDDYTNKQVRDRELDPIFGLLEKLVNIPKSYIYGAEGEIVARPVTGVTFTGSATYLKSRVNSDFSKTQDGVPVYNAQGYTGDHRGSALPFTPSFSATADLQYEWRLRDNVRAFVGGSLLYEGKQNTTFQNAVLQANLFEIPDYTTFDLRAGIGDPDHKWTLTLYGRNVFDKFYTTSVTTFLDTRIRFAGAPATYGVTFNYNFH